MFGREEGGTPLDAAIEVLHRVGRAVVEDDELPGLGRLLGEVEAGPPLAVHPVDAGRSPCRPGTRPWRPGGWRPCPARPAGFPACVSRRFSSASNLIRCMYRSLPSLTIRSGSAPSMANGRAGVLRDVRPGPFQMVMVEHLARSWRPGRRRGSRRRERTTARRRSRPRRPAPARCRGPARPIRLARTTRAAARSGAARKRQTSSPSVARRQ